LLEFVLIAISTPYYFRTCRINRSWRHWRLDLKYFLFILFLSPDKQCTVLLPFNAYDQVVSGI